MVISYNKLWKLMIDKNLKKMQLKEMVNIGTTTLARLGKNEPVGLEVMMRICKVLECDIGDVMEMIQDEK